MTKQANEAVTGANGNAASAGPVGAADALEQFAGMIDPAAVAAVIEAGLTAAADADAGLLLAVTDPELPAGDLALAVNTAAELFLLFGRAGEVTQMRAVAVMPRDLVLQGQQLRFAGNIEHVGGPELGPGRVIDTVGLAISPGGPVLAVCALMPFTWAAGAVFGFAPGAFVFGSK